MGYWSIMKFLSTRGKSVAPNAAYAISHGLAEDGGLYVPENFPCVKEDLEKMVEMSYSERACFLLSKYLEEYDYQDLLKACESAYSKCDE